MLYSRQPRQFSNANLGSGMQSPEQQSCVIHRWRLQALCSTARDVVIADKACNHHGMWSLLANKRVSITQGSPIISLHDQPSSLVITSPVVNIYLGASVCILWSLTSTPVTDQCVHAGWAGDVSCWCGSTSGHPWCCIYWHRSKHLSCLRVL